MRQTLRRSCATCAKSKHACDLRTPRCSRCIKRGIRCHYANEPLTGLLADPSAAVSEAPSPRVHPRARGGGAAEDPAGGGSTSLARVYELGGLDPFDSYPQTRLPRGQVERLIYRFLHKIAFEYYPLDLSATSNPFLVSWWPFALGDPALFHVSLQTACLDEELSARKGFQASEILMADSVALLRRKIKNPSLAAQDGTMNSIITLAAIEFGKGNLHVSQMHVDGVKRLVDMRGGINSVRQTSPLTARMVCWVSMLITGSPQFPTQDDIGIGDGIPPIAEWQIDPLPWNEEIMHMLGDDPDPDILNVFIRLRSIFLRAQQIPLPATQLHDLTCFVVHRLLPPLPPPSAEASTMASPMMECIRCAIILYLLIIQGHTYYSHAFILEIIASRLIHNLEKLDSRSPQPGSLDVWFVTVGLAATAATAHYDWFLQRASTLIGSLGLSSWAEIMMHVKSILWLDTPQGEGMFQHDWDALHHAVEDVTLSDSPLVCGQIISL